MGKAFLSDAMGNGPVPHEVVKVGNHVILECAIHIDVKKNISPKMYNILNIAVIHVNTQILPTTVIRQIKGTAYNSKWLSTT